MPDSPNGKRQYQVHCSEKVAKELYRLQQDASPKKRQQIAVAFRRILKALQRDPTKLGEAAYRLPALRLQVRKVVVRPLAVHFAVNEERSLVFIKGGALLGDHESD